MTTPRLGSTDPNYLLGWLCSAVRQHLEGNLSREQLAADLAAVEDAKEQAARRRASRDR